jgi:hypothetical protein
MSTTGGGFSGVGGGSGGGFGGGFGGGSGGGFGGGSGGGFGGGSGGGFGGGSGGGFGGGSGGGFGGGSGGGFGGGSGGGGSAGGVASCNSGNCTDGCCNGTTCVRAPSNGFNQTCGFGGLSCANCAQSGQVCNQVTLTCMSGTGGGGAGGGTAGGTAGGFGGGTGSYIQTAIVAACDDLSVAATDVLTPNTIPALSDDSASPVMPLPVPFPFFGSLVTHAGVQSNGMVQLFTSSSGTVSTSYMNTSIPSTSAPDGFAAPLWNDLFPDGTSAIRMRAFTAGGARLTVNWLNVAGPNTEFQAKFFTTGVIEFHYCSMAGVATSSATAGVESLSGFSGTEGTFSTTLSGSGMRFTP